MNTFTFVHMMAVAVAVSHYLQSGTRADEMTNSAATNFGQSIHPRIESRRMLRFNDDAVDEERSGESSRFNFEYSRMKPEVQKLSDYEVKGVKDFIKKIKKTKTHKSIGNFDPAKIQQQLWFLFDFMDTDPRLIQRYIIYKNKKNMDHLLDRQYKVHEAMKHITDATGHNRAKDVKTSLGNLKIAGVKVETLDDIAKVSELAGIQIILGHTEEAINAKMVETYRGLFGSSS